MSKIVFPGLIATSQYDYKIKQFSYVSGVLKSQRPHLTSTISAIEIENETKTYWWIFLPASYHDYFYHTRFGPSREIPTQVTGGVAEAVSLSVMKKLFRAKNISRITPRPSSRTADFEMDIIHNGKQLHVLVESKGSNQFYRHPPINVIRDGTLQLLTTRFVKQSHSGYLTLTSYPARTCFVIKVF